MPQLSLQDLFCASIRIPFAVICRVIDMRSEELMFVVNEPLNGHVVFVKPVLMFVLNSTYCLLRHSLDCVGKFLPRDRNIIRTGGAGSKMLG